MESRSAGHVPDSQAVAFRADSLSGAMHRFRRRVWDHYRTHGRHDLPWRTARNQTIYRILVSEIMLQQTQVDRVIPFYRGFLKKFPTAKKLAAAPLSDVLKVWQGLGYNRRAKMLQLAAKELVARKCKTIDELETLPGVGPYTARAVAAFALNIDGVVVETNIRTVIIHHFFPDSEKIPDAELEKVLRKALPEGRSREWYSALMDYGAFLKRSGVSHNAKSTTHVKQSKFAGSPREARGAILRALARDSILPRELTGLLGASRRVQLRAALQALLAENLIEKQNGRYMLAR